MRALLLVDPIFASRERRMLARLEAGLADEGVRVLHAVPEGSTIDADEAIFSRAIQFPESGPFQPRRQVARALLERTVSEDGGMPDVVHAFGGRSWRLAHAVASQAEAGLVLEVWRAGLATQLRRVRELPHKTRGIVASVPSLGLEESVRSEAGGMAVSRVPWGVLAPGDAPPRTGEIRTLMFTGSGRDAAGFHAAFDGVIRAAQSSDHPWMAFVDADMARRAGLWKHIRADELRARVSLIDGMESRRDLVLRGDLLIQTEALGEHRSLLLEAMAYGMALVVRPDPMVDALIGGSTCVFAPEQSREAWEHSVLPLLASRSAAAELGASARKHVREHHRASAQIEALLRCYESVGAAPTLAFDTPRTGNVSGRGR
ncbi:MAG: glycosyltransferase [Planctomycetota bacterium]